MSSPLIHKGSFCRDGDDSNGGSQPLGLATLWGMFSCELQDTHQGRQLAAFATLAAASVTFCYDCVTLVPLQAPRSTGHSPNTHTFLHTEEKSSLSNFSHDM